MRRLSFVAALAALVLTFSAARPAAAQQWFYNGEHAREVHYVLERVNNWRLPSCETCNDLKAPDIPVNPNSTQRDAQVGAAAVYAFGAEAYAKLGKTAEAQQAAEMVHKSLEQANALCSDSPSIEARGMTPATLRIWPCPAPFELD